MEKEPKDIYEWANYLNKKEVIEPSDIEAIILQYKQTQRNTFHNPLNAARAERIRGSLIIKAKA